MKKNCASSWLFTKIELRFFLTYLLCMHKHVAVLAVSDIS